MQQGLEIHKKLLFDSDNKKELKDKDAWIRRAIFWKYMSMALESKNHCDDKVLKDIYENSLSSDLKEAPPIFALNGIGNIAIKAFNSRKKKSKIEVVK